MVLVCLTLYKMVMEFFGRVGLIEVLLGLLDWRTGGRYGLSSHMKWNESEASIGRVLAVEVSYNLLMK